MIVARMAGPNILVWWFPVFIGSKSLNPRSEYHATCYFCDWLPGKPIGLLPSLMFVCSGQPGQGIMSSDIDEPAVPAPDVGPQVLIRAMASYRELQYRGPGLPMVESQGGFPGWPVSVFASAAALAIVLAVGFGFSLNVPTQSVRSYPRINLVLTQPETLRKGWLQRPAGGVDRPKTLKKGFGFTFHTPKRPTPEKTG